LIGEEIKSLHNGKLKPGQYDIKWNAQDNNRKAVPSGVCLYKVTSDSRVLTGKMLLMM